MAFDPAKVGAAAVVAAPLAVPAHAQTEWLAEAVSTPEPPEIKVVPA